VLFSSLVCKMAENSENGKSSFQSFLWNPSKKELLGRTGGSWAKILIFYLIFYACLAAFWTVMLLIFYQTIDPHYPKWQLGESRIGTNPGLGFRPRPPEERVESTLIWFKTSGNDDSSWKSYKEDLDKYLAPYTKDTTEAAIGKGERVANVDDCKAGKQPETGKYCPFNYKDLFQNRDEKCSSNNKYGYDLGSPCILVKLNRIYGWVPQPYTVDDLTNGAKVPSSVASSIKTAGPADVGVYISCEGENAADKENIGDLHYAPSQLIRKNYFPYTNQPGYLSPFVMVHFKQPARGVLINVECKAWAKNIRHERQDREGSVHFELLID